MDNLAHSLAGAALATAGLGRRTTLGTATLVIAANLPDVDALAYAAGETTALAVRRGWTHGILAMLVLPVLLAGAMLLWDRSVRRRRHPGATPARGRQLLLLAAIGVLSHPLLDLLNTYGVRLLMPLSDRWFYGDTLFIVDPWLWIALAAGVLLSWRARKRGRPHPERPSRLALGAATMYIALMAAGTLAARAGVARQARALGLPAAEGMVVGPVPLDPFRRSVLRDVGDRYELGGWEWLPRPRYLPEPRGVPDGLDHPATEAAARTEPGSAFFVWTRMPYAEVRPVGDSLLVTLDDARYANRGGTSFATTRVMVAP